MDDDSRPAGRTLHVVPTDDRFDKPWAAEPSGRVSSRSRLRWWLGLAQLLPAIPAVEVAATAPGSDDPVQQAMTREIAGVRVMRPVLASLDLPPTMADYLRGRSRQALRTNLRKADALGLRAVELLDPALAREVALEVTANRLGYSEDDPQEEWFLGNPGDRWFAVKSADDRWVGFAAIAVSASAAYLRVLFSATAHPDAGPARYRLHTQVVASLMEDGIERLWADGPMTTSPGSRYFQGLLGYYCARPSVRRGRTTGDAARRAPSGRAA